MTKQELRHDAFVDSTARATHWLQQNFMTVVIAVVALVVITLGAIFFQQSHRRSELQAGQLFFQASGLYAQGSYSECLIQLDELISRFGGSREGRAALYLSGASHLGLGENDQAYDRFREYLDREPDGFYAESARLGLGLALEARGQVDEAVDAYRSVRAALPAGDPREVQAAVAEARTLQAAGRIDEAVAALESVGSLEDFAARQEIETRLAALRALR